MKILLAQTLFRKEAGCLKYEGINYFLCKIEGVLYLFYAFALILGVFLLMFAGFKYILSRGADWHQGLVFIILGIIFIIASFTIPVLILSFLK